MGELKGHFPDGINGQNRLIEIPPYGKPEAIKLQPRLSRIFSAEIKLPLDPKIYRKESGDV